MRMHALGADQECEAAYQWLRRMFEDGRYVGAFAALYGLRECWVLRFFEE